MIDKLIKSSANLNHQKWKWSICDYSTVLLTGFRCVCKLYFKRSGACMLRGSFGFQSRVGFTVLARSVRQWRRNNKKEALKWSDLVGRLFFLHSIDKDQYALESINLAQNTSLLFDFDARRHIHHQSLDSLSICVHIYIALRHWLDYLHEGMRICTPYNRVDDQTRWRRKRYLLISINHRIDWEL